MTPDEFNDVMTVIKRALDGRTGIDAVLRGLPADSDGTLPELYVNVNGIVLCLTAEPL